MSSPASRRSQRNSTPARSTRSSVARSSPAPAGPSGENASQRDTPRQSQASRLASSPMFFQSSPINGSAANGASSPLRQMSNTQSTNGNANDTPSSPLRQQTETQSQDGNRTPRASGLLGGKACSLATWDVSWTDKPKFPHRSIIRLAPRLATRPTSRTTCEARAVACLSIQRILLNGRGAAISTLRV